MKTNLSITKSKLVLFAWLGMGETFKVVKSKSTYSLTLFAKPTWVVGVTSMCADGKHVLLLDYDDVLKSVMLLDLQNLQKEGMGPFYIFTTKERKHADETIGNYHIICPVKLTPARAVELQGMTNSDNAYKTMPLRNPYRSWVLRVTEKGRRPKPKFLGIDPGQPNSLEVSTAHIGLIHKLYPAVPKLDYVNQDGSTKIFLNSYETLNRVK